MEIVLGIMLIVVGAFQMIASIAMNSKKNKQITDAAMFGYCAVGLWVMVMGGCTIASRSTEKTIECSEYKVEKIVIIDEDSVATKPTYKIHYIK